MSRKVRARKRRKEKTAQRSEAAVQEGIDPSLGENEMLRSFAIRKDTLDEEKRTVEVSFSSEDPVRDFFGRVILLHERSAVNLKPLREVGAALLNHNPNAIVGSLRDIDIDEETRKGRGVIVFDDDDEGNRAMAKVKSGSLRGVSVRYSAEEFQIIRRDEKWKSPAGREFKGPVDVAVRWTPREISLTPIPADPSVGVNRARQPKLVQRPAKERPLMDEETRKWLESQGLKVGASEDEARAFMRTLRTQADPPSPPREEPANPPRETERSQEEIRKEERQRLRDIETAARSCGADEEQLRFWLESDKSIADINREALELARKNQPGVRGTSTAIVKEEWDKRREYLEVGLCARHNLELVAREYKDYKGDIPDHLSLRRVAEWCLRQDGVQTDWMSELEIANRAVEMAQRAISHSTASFPSILSNVANKVLRSAYMLSEITYERWTRRVSVMNFKPVSLNALSEAEEYVETPELTPIVESTYKEKADTYQIATFARRISISRQAIINDDLGALDRISRFGDAFARTINRHVYNLLKTPPTMVEDGKALFANDHPSGDNLGAGALDSANLGALRTLMRRQKGFGKTPEPLAISPRFLIVPPDLEETGIKLLSPEWVATAVSAVPSPLRNSYQLVVDSELVSAVEYYLAAAPASFDTIFVARLGAQREPVIQPDPNPNILGFGWLSYGDFGVKVVDHRGLAKSTGS